MREVVLVCGAPGSGKTTFARSLGLEVYDRDDARWSGESEFSRTIGRLRSRVDAHAVVIRAGATCRARADAVRLVGATRVVVLRTPLDVCVARVVERGRSRPSMRMQVAAVKGWWAVFEPEEYPAPLGW